MTLTISNLGSSAPHLQIVDQFEIFKDPQMCAMFPSLAKLNDQLIIAFRLAPREPFYDLDMFPVQQHLHPRSMLAIANLNDQFKCENLRMFPSDVCAADQDPNLTILADNGLLLTSFSWRPILEEHASVNNNAIFHEKVSRATGVFWGSFTSTSMDGGISWECRKYLPKLPNFPDIVAGHRDWHGGRHRGQVVQLSSQDLLLATYDRLHSKSPFCSFTFKSSDQGKNWSYNGELYSDKSTGSPVGVAEPSLFPFANGVIYAFHRTFNAQGRLGICYSHDYGVSWSDIELVNIIGHPFQIIRISDEFAFIVYGVRDAISSIRGRIISLKNNIISDEEIIICSGAESTDIGYPWAILVGDGKVLVSYYWIDKNGTRYIKGALVRML